MLEGVVGAIGAALVAAVLSLLSLIISKEQTTSGFRQAWVDALRTEIATAISSVAVLGLMLSGDQDEEASPEVRATFGRISASLASIELRLNPDEDEHIWFAALIRETEQMIGEWQVGDYEQARAVDLNNRVVAQAQRILKIEWERVKAGELTYRMTKYGAMVIAGAGAVTLAAWYVL